jgi:hypothetical protein
MKKLFFSNQRTKFVLAALVIFLFLSGQKLFAQNEDFTVYWTSHSINSWASNYTPKINEPVTITVELESPVDFYQSGNIGFTIQPGMELLSGTNRYTCKLKKGEKVSIKAVVKFTERKVFDLNVDCGKSVRKLYSIYVDGAFRENSDISSYRYSVNLDKKALESMKKDSLKDKKLYYEPKEYNSPLPELLNEASVYQSSPGGIRLEFNRTKSLFLYTKYDSLNIEATKKYNLEVVYYNLNQEFKSIHKGFREIKKAIYEKRQALKKQELQKQNLGKSGAKSKTAPEE